MLRNTRAILHWYNLLAHREYSTRQAPQKLGGLRQVQNVIAVASGKGGVGKSTAAVNIATSLAVNEGLQVGLLDADIHGPSVPTMMNLRGKPGLTEGEPPLLVPLENYRVRCMSMGFFMEGDKPVVWRGPMVNRMIDQFLTGTEWGRLDALVVDLPPGTGDAQMNLTQRLPLAGAVIISTPQHVALLDARRGAQMFKLVQVPLLGLVENMAYYACGSCGHKEPLYGSSGVPAAAKELEVPLLGQVPFEPSVVSACDQGVPVVVGQPESATAQAYKSIAHQIAQQLAERSGQQQAGPKIVVQQ